MDRPRDRLAFVGGGVMGEAIIRGVLDRGVVRPEAITVADISEARLDHLRTTFGVRTTPENAGTLPGAKVVVLAVKPQTFPEAGADLASALEPGQLVLSIMAGIPIKRIRAVLGHERIVRAMPNTPGQIGRGISVWTATAAVDPEQREFAQAILRALGNEIFVPDEHYLDMATAVSGSGPAYVFLFLEAFVEAGVHIGLPWDMARRLALETVAGSCAYAEQAGRHLGELKNLVSSPAGTTVEGLLRLEEAGVRAAVIKAVQAAYQRSLALGE